MEGVELKLLLKNQEQVKEHLEKSLNDHYTALSGRIRSENALLDLQIKHIIEEDKKRNGVLGEYGKAIIDLQASQRDCLEHRGKHRAVVRNWKLWLVGIIAGMYGLHRAFEAVEFSQIIIFVQNLIN